VDYFIGPEVLVAHDILKYIINPSSLAVENFAHGSLQLRTLLIPNTWHAKDATLKNLNLPANIIVGLIRRDSPDENKKTVIFPHGDDAILPGDEVTFIGASEAISELHSLFDIWQKEIQHVVIIGGSLTGRHLANLLVQRDIDVRIIDKSYERCCQLAERVPHSTIMHHDATDIEFLRGEKINHSDIVVICTNRDEVNLLTALLSKEVGCQNILIMLNNPNYIPMVTELGFQYVASPRHSATNHILSQLFFGKVTSLISLYENQAEVIEITVSMDSKVVGIPLSELGPYLPKDLLIVMIQNRGRIMIAHGDRIISPGDTVIVVTNPKHVDELERIF
jgi:trk system potassium uptake protein